MSRGSIQAFKDSRSKKKNDDVFGEETKRRPPTAGRRAASKTSVSSSLTSSSSSSNSRDLGARLRAAEDKVTLLESTNVTLKKKLAALRGAQAPMTRVVKAATQVMDIKRKEKEEKIVEDPRIKQLQKENKTLLSEKTELEEEVATLREKIQNMEDRYMIKVEGLQGELTTKIDMATQMSNDINRLTALVRRLQDEKDRKGSGVDMMREEMHRVRQMNDMLSMQLTALQKENADLRKKLDSNGDSNDRMKAMQSQFLEELKRQMMKEVDSLRLKAGEMQEQYAQQVDDMQEKWRRRELNFKELWDSREKEFEDLLARIKQNTKVKVTRSVTLVNNRRGQGGDSALARAGQGMLGGSGSESVSSRDLEDFPDLLKDLNDSLGGWSKSSSTKLNFR